MIGVDPLSLVHPDDRDAVAAFFEWLRANPDENRRLIYRIETTTGEYSTLESIGRKRDRSGFGLGIVETIATAHGWTVATVVAVGGGARFEFREVELTPHSASDP